MRVPGPPALLALLWLTAACTTPESRAPAAVTPAATAPAHAPATATASRPGSAAPPASEATAGSAQVRTSAAPVPAPGDAAARDQRAEAGAAGLSRVRQVIDGDTITVSGIGVVRLLGVDAPEKTGGRRPPEPYGDEAHRFLRRLLEGQLVFLEYDGERLDPYRRTLAYVILQDGRVANEEIIRAGWARAYRRFNYYRKRAFQLAEQDARANRRGMWQGK